MKPYILLTPGPLTTSETVKEAMLTDWCTWDADYNVHIVEEIRKSLVALATKQTGNKLSASPGHGQPVSHVTNKIVILPPSTNHA